ncbi:ATP-binding protein [Streptomyces sp. KM273126]|uniref:ATP-binding protein n=1 Tax=Streptomyces sp. KM273126 TaxID=2545247 RepID=UPI0015EC90AD|nr:ATP-binding protein [Streptomyces sp. KM273126]
MTTNPGSPTSTAQLGTPTPHLGHVPDPRDEAFDMRFTSTPRGARLARRLAAVRLDEWGIRYGTEAHDAIVLITAELTTNAVRHGHVSGRDFHLRLTLRRATGTATARVDVTDTRAERLPPHPAVTREGTGIEELEETGRGLLLVSHLATRWDRHPRPDGPGKTIWAEYVVPGA